MGYSPWGRKESDTTERLSTHAHTHVTLDDQDSFSPLGNTVSTGRHVQVRTWVSLESAVSLSWAGGGGVRFLWIGTGCRRHERRQPRVEGGQGPGGRN